MLEALHVTVHGTSGSFGDLTGLAGVLVSPSRGLLIFSPVVLLAAAGGGAAIRGGWRRPPAWCLLAAAFQYVLYGTYAVWWGGHTYGPRYMLDLLPLLAPVAIAGAERLARPRAYAAAGVALAWSIGVAATGAFYYPNDRWNTDPADVDRYHDRLWEWSDSQIVRCWTRGPSPQNFRLFTREAFRVEP
jgi:hypothetical protein